MSEEVTDGCEGNVAVPGTGYRGSLVRSTMPVAATLLPAPQSIVVRSSAPGVSLPRLSTSPAIQPEHQQSCIYVSLILNILNRMHWHIHSWSYRGSFLCEYSLNETIHVAVGIKNIVKRLPDFHHVFDNVHTGIMLQCFCP